MRHDMLQRIADRTMTEADLSAAIDQLGAVTEPPSFWLAIANDRSYAAAHRAVAICQFFKRHITVPVELVQLARLLDHPDWLAAAAITVVKHLKGEIAVAWNPGETVLAIRLFQAELEHAPVLYLRLSQPLAVEDFMEIVQSAHADPAAGGVRVLEVACVT